MSDSTPQTVQIPLTRGYTTIVDAIDAELAQYHWQADIAHTGAAYARRRNRSGDGSSRMSIHRLVMERVLGRKLTPSEFVDHKDRNTLNNCRDNLRLTNRSGNLRNSKRRVDNASGYKCVYKRVGRSGNIRWTAHIYVNRKQIKLGCFDTPEEAHEAYKRAALEHYGEFARFE